MKNFKLHVTLAFAVLLMFSLFCSASAPVSTASPAVYVGAAPPPTCDPRVCSPAELSAHRK